MNAPFRPGLAGPCKSAPMTKPIRTLGAAVVALATPALLAAPAAADARGAAAKVETRLGDDTRLTLAIGSAGYDSHRREDGYRGGDGYRRDLNQWGQSDREVRDLTRDAVQTCRQAVRQEARYLGYRDIDIDEDRRVRQVGPRGFFVTFDEVEFEGRRRDREARVTCEIRRGDVVSLEGLPRPARGRAPPPRRGW